MLYDILLADSLLSASSISFCQLMRTQSSEKAADRAKSFQGAARFQSSIDLHGVCVCVCVELTRACKSATYVRKCARERVRACVRSCMCMCVCVPADWAALSANSGRATLSS